MLTSGVRSRVAMILTLFRNLITLDISTREPSSRVIGMGLKASVRNSGFGLRI